ncbi:DUF6268 family outer membrane beta-barrel protein [Fulvivirga sediminis]|uniref:Histidine kinase n=1 Tax=Fulvivirga sediminis TaxID=2803949 RepID=A0A937FAC0_9BACT|nr:DUF6268 family outer membrane beta-barrel protein [Fulvivirga sediminis]MBL3657210.1 histidine kinase [Fulvivirga sediminis]
MKAVVYKLLFLAGIITFEAKAQVNLKTEYFGKSSYIEEVNDSEVPKKVGEGKGYTMVYSGDLTIPFYQQLDTNSLPISYGVSISGAYASLDHKLKDTATPAALEKEILNVQAGFYYLKPLSEKWSLLATAGGGVFSPSAKPSEISNKQVIGSISTTFIRHIKPNLDLGIGLSVNNIFKHVMALPSVYLDWNIEKKIKVNAAIGEGVKLQVGYNFSDYFSTSLLAELNGQIAFVNKNGEDKIFYHQYIITGIHPEINIPKLALSIPFTLGISAYRPVFYSDRSLKSLFSTDHDYYYFNTSLYASIGISYNF